MSTVLVLFSLGLAIVGCLLCLRILKLARSFNGRRAVQLAGLLLPVVVLSLLSVLMAHFVARVHTWAAPAADLAVAWIISVVGAALVMGAIVLNAARGLLLPWHLRWRTWTAPAWLEAATDQIVDEAGVRSSPRVRVALDERPWALVAGLFRPHLVISSGLLALLDEEELAAVLHHELLHVRRGDLWWTAIGGVLRDLTWFVPSTRRLYCLMLAEQELACDDCVVGEQRRVALASALARVWQAGIHAGVHASKQGKSRPSVRGALGIFSPEQGLYLEARVRRLLDGSVGPWGPARLGDLEGPAARSTFTLAGLLLAPVVLAQLGMSLVTMNEMGCDLPRVLWSLVR